MTKVVYNACYGGFGLSNEAFEAILDRKGIEWVKSAEGHFRAYRYTRKDNGDYLSQYDFEESRVDPDVIAVIEEFKEKGKNYNGMSANLVIEDLPEGTKYRITEYDGNESIETEDDIGWNIA